ncbi:trichohyalin-like [Myripristis murdjan]|uniref:trichohyalin-like n=1 Tax=Myripristis murdjan TaxID=586833 RepID=UPI0011762110|nr:trichohyalin-like [Myripristis murdjan]
MSSNWSDFEIRELLSIRAEPEIDLQLSGTVRDAVVYEKIAKLLQDRGISRQKSQVISKLKTLRKKYLQMTAHHGSGGSGRLHWLYFEACQLIWGSGPASRPAGSGGGEDAEDGDDAAAGPSYIVEVDSKEDITLAQVDEEKVSATESRPESPPQPPRKRKKKLSRMQHAAEEMLRVFAELDRDFHERESRRIQEQRRYEERVRKEAIQLEKEERERQMSMWREMMESQQLMMRELLSQLSPQKESPPQPPRKKLSRMQHAAEEMHQVFAELDRDFHERESRRIQEQREYEERVRNETRELEKEEQERQTCMWREMMESQQLMMRELLSQLVAQRGRHQQQETPVNSHQTNFGHTARQHTAEQDSNCPTSASSSFTDMDNTH